MKKSTKGLILVSMDIVFMLISFFLALYLHYEGQVTGEIIAYCVQVLLLIIPIKVIIFRHFTLYSSLWEFASVEELVKVVFAVGTGSLINVSYMLMLKIPIYLGVYMIALAFEIGLVGGSRFGFRCLRKMKVRRRRRFDGSKNVLIVGCGSTASLIATEIKNHPRSYGRLIGFVDDDQSKIGRGIAGTMVLGNRHDIYAVSRRYQVDEIIITIPSLMKEDVREILEECKRTGAKVRMIPGILEIMDGKISMNKIRDVEIEDLLGRDPVDLNVGEIASYIEKKTVLITGGGGSIGSELCRQISQFKPQKLIILDIYENNAYQIQMELMRKYGDLLNLEVIIASVRDRENIFEIIKKQKPDVIFHAAAHKHVPLMEHSPKEAIKNNVFGTMNVAEAAHEYGVERFVLISTDKAVNPTNVMGASKRMCEMVIQGLAKTSTTKFAAVRFGNVLGSNGSVIPLFKKQIAEGGPVTITHTDIIRYFMTIPEASQLVIQAGAIAGGGEIFILDMGEPVKIYNLAEDLIRLSGFEPHVDIPIVVTGLRPGEKLYEELLMAEEGLQDTKYKKIFIGNAGNVTYPILKKSCEQLRDALKTMSDAEIKEYLKVFVPTYLGDQRKVVPERVIELEDHGVACAREQRTRLHVLRT